MSNGSNLLRSQSNNDDEINDSIFFKVVLSTAIAIIVMSPVAVIGNGLVLAAIWKNPSLRRTPCYVLLAGLAFTDFCNGFITEPFYVTNLLLVMKDPSLANYSRHHYVINERWPTYYLITKVIGDGFLEYFFALTILLITVMAIERWLQMSRQSFVTVRRACKGVAVLSLLPLSVVVCFFRLKITLAYFISYFSFILFCLFVTSIAYFKVFKIIRHHQNQISLQQNSARPAIDFLKYRRSVSSILLVLLVFYFGYLPMAILFMIISIPPKNDFSITIYAVLQVTVVAAFLSSSLNPLLYLWRTRDIQREARQILKRIFCKES